MRWREGRFRAAAKRGEACNVLGEAHVRERPQIPHSCTKSLYAAHQQLPRLCLCIDGRIDALDRCWVGVLGISGLFQHLCRCLSLVALIQQMGGAFHLCPGTACKWDSIWQYSRCKMALRKLRTTCAHRPPFWKADSVISFWQVNKDTRGGADLQARVQIRSMLLQRGVQALNVLQQRSHARLEIPCSNIAQCTGIGLEQGQCSTCTAILLQIMAGVSHLIQPPVGLLSLPHIRTQMRIQSAVN